MLDEDLALFGLSVEACFVRLCFVYCVLCAQEGRKIERYFAKGRLSQHFAGRPVEDVDSTAVFRLVQSSPKARAVLLDDECCKLFRHCAEQTGALFGICPC